MGDKLGKVDSAISTLTTQEKAEALNIDANSKAIKFNKNQMIAFKN